MLEQWVRVNRSYRRFEQAERLTEQTLRSWVALAREVGSAGNAQPLRYRIVREEKACAEVFAALGWAAQLPDWKGPEEGERPAAYIIMLKDRAFSGDRAIDVGIAAQTMLLGAAEQGYGGCMLLSVDKKAVYACQGIDPEKYDIALVIALGRPKEDVRLVDVKDGQTRYYRDAQGVHYVPKRALEDIIV